MEISRNNEGTKTQRGREQICLPAEIEQLASAVVNAAFSVHKELGPGLLESAYEACLAHELGLCGIGYQRQVPVPFNYKGQLIDVGFRADVLVENKLLVELKAVDQLAAIHRAQVITYLKILRLPLGLLINFNEQLIKTGLHRVLNLDLFGKFNPADEQQRHQDTKTGTGNLYFGGRSAI